MTWEDLQKFHQNVQKNSKGNFASRLDNLVKIDRQNAQTQPGSAGNPSPSASAGRVGTAPAGTRIQSDYEAAQRANARRNYEYRQTTGQLPSQSGEDQELSHRRDVVRDRQVNYLQNGGTVGSSQNQVFQRSIDAIDAEIAGRQNDRQKEAQTRAKNTADALKYNQKTFEKRAKEAKKQYGEASDEYRAAQQRADEATKAVWEAGLPWQMRVANYADAVGGRLVGTAPQLAATLTRPPENEIRDNELSRRYQAMNNWLQSAADYFYDVSAQGNAALKYGLGKVGSTVADVAVAGGEMLSDAAMNMILPGSGMAAMGLRAGASGANEAYHAGATPGQEFMYGAATAGVEMLTEKMFDGMAKVYGAGAADEITEGIVRRLAETNGGRTLARMLINTPGEGIEEVVSDLANPFIKYIYDNGAALQESYGTGEGFKSMMQEAGYDFLVGAILGVGGAAASLANGESAARNARLALQDDFIAQMSTGDGSSFFIEPHSGQTTRFGVEQYGDTWWGYAIDGQGKTYWQNGYKSRSAAERGTAVAASDWIVEQAANPENRANDADVRARDEQRAETAAENPGSTIADDQAVEIQKTLQGSGAKNSSLAQAVKLSGIVDKILNGDTSLSNREILSLDLYHNGGLLDIVEQKTGEKIDTSSNKKILAGIRSIIEQRAERFEAEDAQKTAQAAAATQAETQILPQIKQEAATDVQETVLADEAQEPAVQTEMPVVNSIPDNTEKPGQASARTKSPILSKAEMDAYNAGREERLEKARQKGAEKRARVKKEKEEAARRESAGKQAEETAESQPIVNNKSVAIPNGNGYTGENQSGYDSLAQRLDGYNMAVADGIRYSITRTADGYRVSIDRAKGTGGYVTDARANAYHGGPFATREEAVSDLLSVARSNFYPEQRVKEDLEDIDGNAIRAELERRRASGESPVDNMLRQAEQIEDKQFGIKKEDKNNGTETVEEVFDGGTVRTVRSGRPDAGGLLDGVSSEDVRQDAQRGDADPDSAAESGGTSGLARGDAAPGVEGVRSAGLHQGGSVRTTPGEVKQFAEFDANGNPVYATNRGEAGVEAYDYLAMKQARAEADNKYGITPDESRSLAGYTQTTFSMMNRKMLDDTVAPVKDQPVVNRVLSALKKFPAFDGKTYRNLKFKTEKQYNDFLEKHAAGKTVTLKSFTSTSKRPNGYPLFGDRVVHMVISGKTGADIADTYGIPRQQEVILLPGTEIEIVSVTTANDGHPLIYAQEVATHGVETDHGDARPAQGPAGNRREDRSGRPGAGGDGEQSGAVRKSARDHNGRDGVLSERGESDPALTTEETSAPATTEEQIAEKADRGNQEQPRGSNYVIGAKGQNLPTTPKARYKANANAIKTLRAIMAEGRLATAEEQEILAKYTGWGGLSDVFDEKKTDWAKEYKQLKKLLDDGEHKTAKGSILDAYYTEPSIIQGMYNGLAKLGFAGGRLLEPSAGVGRFMGAMPADMLGGVKSWTAVELDKITGNIAKYLYPNADVRVQGFEAAKIPDNYMDVVIGNVPFGNFGVADKAYPAAITKSIHNYFIAKSLDKARPGGIVAVITSRETLDATGEAARSYFMKQADLIGAIRLPNTAFQGTGTNVISDILVFKKREPGTAYKGEKFLEVGRKPWEGADRWGSYEQNEYFMNHPEMVLGTAGYGKGQFGRTVITYNPLDSNVSLQKQIEKAFGRIKVKMDYTTQPTQEKIREEIRANAKKGKQGSLVNRDGKLYKNDGGQLVETKDIKQADVQRMTDILGIRDAARTLLDLQLDDGGTPAITKARKQLNTLYDAFVQKHGYLNSAKNKKLVQKDTDSPFVLALEEYNQDTGEAKKAAIFTKNTVTPIVTVTHADTVEEALTVSMNETGTVDVDRIAQLTGQQADNVRREMLERSLAFKNRNGDLEAAELYLAGNVRAKLRDAEALAEGDSDYQRNVNALRKVIPADIPADEIKVRLGATWVPDTVYSAFVGEMLGGAGMTWKSGQRVPAIEVKYNRPVGKFFVEINDAWLRNRPENTSTWGTPDYPFVGGRNNILEAALNNKTVSVWRSMGDNKRVLDKQATAAAQEKLEKVLAEFQRWIWSDDTRRSDLGSLYNDVFNNTVTPKYDGTHLTVNGSNPDMEMRPHQKNAVQRIINSGGNTLLAHRVGAGKTYEMAAAAMKLRQLGIVKKPLFTVPKHLVAQWGNEFLSYFPAAKILVLEHKDFTPANRKLFANRIATGDYDAVIMSYEQFGMVPMSQANQEAFYQEQIDALEMAILESKRASGKKDPSVRDMERSKKSFEAKLKKLGDGKKDVDNIDFEQLGVDALFVDEAHNFKNLFYTTKMQGVADLGDKEGSQRAFDLYMKVRYLQRLNGGRGIVFATATPVMNSVVELYTMQRYLQGDLLDAKGLTNFDAWANQFGDVVTIRKMKTGGNGYELKQSLSKYKNLAEMQQMFRGFADVIVDAADLPYLKIPKMKTGKRIVVECDPSPFQEQFMEELGRRAEALRGAGKGGSEDHIFKVFDDGKKISYTQRMVDGSLPYEDGGKIMKCVENVYRIWNDTKADKGTQLIFCDRGTPGGAEAGRGVSLYEDMKNLLVGQGIPAGEIAFIHDAATDEAKAKLFKDVNDGTVRVLIGSTSKMGTGMNAQKRIAALHELNAPDRPGDLEQNEGRALRQGNMNDEVAVYAYVTKKTFDSRQWDNLKRKATFIHQIMAGEYNGREAEGDGDLALSAAEISAIASDNPLIMEQFEVSEKIANLENLERAHTKEVAQAKQRITKAQQEIVRDEEYLERYRSDLASRQDTTGDKFRIVLGGKTYMERKAAGEAFVALAKKALNISEPTESNTKVGSFAGFDLYVTSKGYMLLRGKAQYRGAVNMQSAAGTVTALENIPRRLENIIAATETRLSENRASISKLEQTINTPFSKAGDLIAARVREAEILAELNPPSEQALAAAEDEGDVESMVDYDVTVDAVPHPERWEAQRVGSNDTTPMRLSEIVEKIRHDFGLNITSGHVRGTGVRGQYDQRNKGIRSKIVNDLPTISHELGHALSHRYGLLGNSLSAAMKTELENALGEMKVGYSKKQWHSEGLAEYIRKFLQNRETAAIDYPVFTEHFLNSLSAKDAALIEQLADEINAYYSLDADTATSSVRLREEGRPDARTLGEKIRDKADVLYQAWTDSNHGIKLFDEETGADTYKLATNAAYSDAIAGQVIIGDLTDANGKYISGGLTAALHGINLKDKEAYRLFGEYLIVRHGPERFAEGMRIFADDRKNSKEFMDRRAMELEQQHPEFKEAADRLYQFQRDCRQAWLVDTGLISADTAEQWDKRWQYYVPLNRAVSMKARGIGSKRGFANQKSPIKKARGSGLDIIHPVDNIINNIVLMVNAGVRNNVMRKITDEAGRLGADASLLEHVPTPIKREQFRAADLKEALKDTVDNSEMTAEDKMFMLDTIGNISDVLEQFSRGKAYGDVITVMKEGKPEFWKVNDPLLLESITSMSPARQAGVLDVFARVSRFMTANITGRNLVWNIFSNLPRDIMTFAAYSKEKNPWRGLTSVASAWGNRFKKPDKQSALYKEFLALGGGRVSAYTSDKNIAESARKHIARGGRFEWWNPLEIIDFVADTVENGPRFATYKMMRENGLTEQEAFYEAMDITVNFRRGGRLSRDVNKIVPFFNAGVQGLDKFRRWISAADAPSSYREKTIVKRVGMYITASIISAAIEYAINHRNDDDEMYYHQLSAYTKHSYWCIPMGDGKFFCIPKPRELGVPASFFADVLNRAVDGDPYAFNAFYEYAANAFLPSVASDVAQLDLYGAIGNLGLIGVVAYMAANRDFLGRPIESTAMRNLLPEDRFTEKTAITSKWLGRAFSKIPGASDALKSPAMWDYFLSNTLGGFQKANKALFPVGSENRDWSLGVKNTWVKDARYSTDLVNWMYDRAEASSQEKRSNPDDPAIAVRAKMDDNLKSFYSSYYALAKNEKETEESTSARQTVLNVISEYRLAADYESPSGAEEVVRGVAERLDDTSLLPGVMNTYVKNRKGEKITLSAPDYVKYQMDYLRIYWEGVERLANRNMSDSRLAESFQKAKTTAKNVATGNALSRIGEKSSVW